MVYTCLYYILIMPPIYDKSGDGPTSLITMEQRREARASTANKARVITQLVTEVSEKTSVSGPRSKSAQGFMFFFGYIYIYNYIYIWWFFPVLSLQQKTSRNNTADCSHHPPWLLPRHSQCTESSPCHHSPTCRSISRCSSSKHLSWLASYQIYCIVHQTKARATSSVASIQKGDINCKAGDELDSEIQAHWGIGLSESRVLLFFYGWSSSSPPWIENTPPFLDPDAWFLCLDCCRHLAVRTKQFRKTCAAMTAQPRSFFVELAGDHKFLVSAFK